MMLAVSSPSASSVAYSSAQTGAAASTTGSSSNGKTSTNTAGGTARGPNGQPLDAAQQQQVSQLQKIDKATRAHEQAHLAAAAGLAVSGPNYQMTTGPDGKQYANGGDVQVDVSEGRTPEETVRKARIIQAAALAPVDPSAQDLSVAAQAVAMEQKAEQQIAQRSRQGQQVANAYQPDLPAISAFSSTA